jgi:hypothetical protein
MTRRQLSPRGHHLSARLIRRAERVCYKLDPYLLALVIALAGLNLTCYVAMRALL